MLAALLLVLSLLVLAGTYQTPAAGLARLALGASLAMLLAGILTPVVGAAAARFGIVDRPDGRLKNHPRPVPYLGGLALGLSFLLALSLLFRYDQKMTGVLLAGAVALLLGLVDDLGSLTWRAKFAGQGLAVLVLLKSGVMMNIAVLPPWMNAMLSALWLLGLINALNLIDISDGLAPGVALFASAAFLVVAVFDGAALLAILAATLFGALAGFAPYNFFPARIYLGDAGSMFLGLTLGGISFDMAYVMLLRALRGRSPFLGSPDHLAVRLRRLGWSPQRIALAACLTTAGTSAAGISLLFLPARLAFWPVLLVVGGLGVIGLALARVDVTGVTEVMHAPIVHDAPPETPRDEDPGELEARR